MEGLSDIVQLCVNSDTKLALRSDGTGFGWQDNLYGTIDESAQMAECYFPMPVSVINPDIQANVNYRYSKTKTCLLYTSRCV